MHIYIYNAYIYIYAYIYAYIYYAYIYKYMYRDIDRDIAIDIPYIEHLGYTCHSEWQKFRET